MPTNVPESVGVPEPEGLAAALDEALESLLEVTRATAGWVGLTGSDGRLSFPAIRGRISASWLALQQGTGVWGFAVREGPTLLNDLPAWPTLGEPILTNLLSCPVAVQDTIRGHVVLANKANGFTSHDCSVLLGMAHLMSKWLRPAPHCHSRTDPLQVALLQSVLDRRAEAILVMDSVGTLLFASSQWSDWTGYRLEELLNQTAPFGFWISHRDLMTLGGPTANLARAAGALPFRHRSGSIFWCQVESNVQELAGRSLTFAFLRRVPSTAAEVSRQPRQATFDPVHGPPADWRGDRPQPPRLALLLQPGAAIQFWDAHWQNLTGLCAEDLADVPTEVVLDWLFPRQHERDLVASLFHQPRQPAQLVLDVLSRTGSQSMQCTFLPVASQGEGRWLLLAAAHESPLEENSPAMAHVSQFARELSQLLNHFLAAPLELAELGAERADLPPEAVAQFEQIRAGCQHLTGLIGLLQNLGAVTAGDMRPASLAEVVREFLAERAAVVGAPGYVLETALPAAGDQVRINRRLFKEVLDQLLTSAEQALVDAPRQRIEVRVFTREDTVCCEIEDNSEGLSPEAETRVRTPGCPPRDPLARDTAPAALKGSRLGQIVSQHLLRLQGGRLEWHRLPGEGTVATISLPGCKALPEEQASAPLAVAAAREPRPSL